MKLIYYSLATPGGSACDQQWIQSIRSLRRHNSRIPVHLALYDSAPEAILWEARRWNVTVHYLGSYPEYLDSLYLRGRLLASYPTFHKFLSLHHLPLGEVSQVLFLDCDTFFFADIEALFDFHQSHHWYAREEPASARSYLEPDPFHIDENALDAIVRAEGLRPIFPFNSGVFLLNHGLWNALEPLRIPYLDFAWRLLMGQQLAPVPERSSWDVELQRSVLSAATAYDHARALHYPSRNHWIIEEIALWLTLGHVPGLSQGLLSRDLVAQNGEFRDVLRPGGGCVAVHYFNSQETDFFSTVGLLG